MNIVNTNWQDFRSLILNHIKERKGPQLCRGQANSSWKLRTSFHRSNVKQLDFKNYFENLIPYLADAIETLEGRTIDVANPVVNGAFLAYAQHHGLPTPLLDWTYSPYKAAYYAFSSIEDASPLSDHAAIYVFDHLKWLRKYKQVLNYLEESPHVSILQAKSMGNHRQIFQQGTYIFTNLDDIEEHIISHEEQDGEEYLTKYLFSVREKPLILDELEAMGINAYSLFGGSDGMFRFFKESVFRADSVGLTPADRLKVMMELWQKKGEEERSSHSQPLFPNAEDLMEEQGAQMGLFQLLKK